jgi:hypothetical protein
MNIGMWVLFLLSLAALIAVGVYISVEFDEKIKAIQRNRGE